MKTKIFSFLLLIATFCTLLSQKKEDYRKAEIMLNNGTKMNVLFVGYTYPNGNFLSNFAKSNVYKFEYKQAAESKTEKVDAKDVKSLTIFDDSGELLSKIEKLDLKTINGKGEAVDKTRDSFQLLLYDGKIQIYGSNIFECAGNGKELCRYSYSVFYIKNAKDEYAIMPIDFDRITIFNIGSIPEKMVEAFRFVGKDCPEFQNYLKIFQAKIVEKSFQKEMKNNYKDLFNKATDDAKKSGQGFGKAQELFGDYMLDYYLNFYGGVVKEYEKNCK